MSWVAVAVGGGALVGAGASYYGARANSRAMDNATDATLAAQQASIAEQRREFDYNASLMQPWVTSGANNLAFLNQRMMNGEFQQDPFSFSISDYENSPAYRWQMDQGVKALTDAGLAGGRLGTTQTGVEEYAQNLANTYYNSYFNNALATYNTNQTNLNNLFNQYAGLAGTGQTAATNLGSAAMTTGANIGNAYQTGGTNLANIAMAQGQNTANMYTGLANQFMSAAGTGMTAYQNNNLMNMMYNNQYGYNTPSGFALYQ